MGDPNIMRMQLSDVLTNQPNSKIVDYALVNLQNATAGYQHEQDQAALDAAMLQAMYDKSNALYEMQERDYVTYTEVKRQLDKETKDYNAYKTEMAKCQPQEYNNMKNLIHTYQTAVDHNKSLVNSSGIHFNASRVDELNTKHSALQQQKVELISSIEQHERDFIDTRDALPEVLPDTSIHTLDDYTLWILILSYSLFVVSMIFYYCYINAYTPTSILISIVSAALLTIFLFILGILLL